MKAPGMKASSGTAACTHIPKAASATNSPRTTADPSLTWVAAHGRAKPRSSPLMLDPRILLSPGIRPPAA